MLFNSWVFVAFFLVTFIVYYLPALRRVQVPFLVIASFVFYSWTFPGLLALLLISILLNAITSFRVANTDDQATKVRWATAGVIINLAILAFFKYGGLITKFFVGLGHLDDRQDAIQFLLHIPLPIGISFYTFEGISLLVDVFKKNRDESVPPKPIAGTNFWEHLKNTGLFVAFFPHLIAGPILKARQFFPQIGVKRFLDIDWEFAIRMLIMGYFLKMVVADNLKDQTQWISSPFYLSLSTSTGLILLFGYSMQIFADFAGYSLIAVGLATLFGYNLIQNFNFPYISRTLSEFWRRWHISLSTWLRDYLYFPLGGNRKSAWRTYFNLAIVMVLGGLWHGAAWSYAVWGAYHGLGLAVERFFTRDREEPEHPNAFDQLVNAIKMLAVFSFVTLGWLLFKLPDFGQVLEFLDTMRRNVRQGPDLSKIAPVLLYSLPVVIYHLLHIRRVKHWRHTQDKRPSSGWQPVVVLSYALMLAAIVLNYGSSADFIYFQF